MSTRSGRRIHSSFHENTVKVEAKAVPIIQRKTRGKRQKENDVDLNQSIPRDNKRKNYVSYPADSHSTDDDAAVEMPPVKSSRKTRGNTLKDHNTDLQDSGDSNQATVTKILRLTRNARRFVQSDIKETTEVLNGLSDVKNSGSKKGKKKKSKKVQNENVISPDKLEQLAKIISDDNQSEKSTRKKKGPKKPSRKSENLQSANNSSVESFHNATSSPPPVPDMLNEEHHQSATKTDANHGNLNETFARTEDKNISEPENTSLRGSNKKEGSKRKLSKANAIDIVDGDYPLTVMDTTFDKNTDTDILNTTYDSNSKSRKSNISNSLITENSSVKLNTTFDRSESQKSSLVSPDCEINTTFDKSDNQSDSKTENILNMTPVLIESSFDDTKNSFDNSKRTSKCTDNRNSNISRTPLKRESTFTKSPPGSVIELKSTPTDTSISAAGSTPFHTSRSSSRISQKDRGMLNVTRSIEKPPRSSISSPVVMNVTRQTRVMFCSPTKSSVMDTQMKRKIIKSSMKGSNKTFVYEDNERALRPSALPRKRSMTASEADATCSKRTRLDAPTGKRTRAATALPTLKLPTPKKPSITPRARTALPDFAALHQRRFAKMESLDECQLRKAERAKQLLTPSRLSTKAEQPKPSKSAVKSVATPSAVSSSKTYTLESLRPGFTRFGFKMHSDFNPFSVPSKTEVKAKEMVVNEGSFYRFGGSGCTKTAKSVKKPFVNNKLVSNKEKSNPAKTESINVKDIINNSKNTSSIKAAREKNNPFPIPKNGKVLNDTNTTSKIIARKEQAKRIVMREREKSPRSDHSRNQARTVIKGVRTNRRFELQMQMRGLE